MSRASWAFASASAALALAFAWFVEFTVALAEATTPRWSGWEDVALVLLAFFCAARAAWGTATDALVGASIYAVLVPLFPLVFPTTDFAARESGGGLLLLGGVFRYGFGAALAGAWTGIVSEAGHYLGAHLRRWREVAAGTADPDERPPPPPRCLRFGRVGVVILTYSAVFTMGIVAAIVIGAFGPLLAFVASWPATALVAARYDARRRGADAERACLPARGDGS